MTRAFDVRPYYRAIDRADVVSFDVFDTLIHRAVGHPTHVFDVVAAKLRQNLLGLLNPGGAENFAAQRIQAETLARERWLEETSTAEIGFAQIYECLREISSLSETECGEVADLELECERLLCFANPIMQEIFQYAQSRNKQIILCSDMYLSETVIRALLADNGFLEPFELFVSNELGLSKHEGSMWPHLLSVAGVPAESIVHFGDNHHADVASPTSAGISSYHFDYLSDYIGAGRRSGAEAPAIDRHVWSLTQGVIAERLMHGSRGFWHDIGLQVFGPLLLGKQIWLTTHAKRDGVEKMLFFARDAYLSHQIFKRYGSAMGLDVPSEYAYFSRAAMLLPSFVDMPIERVYHLFSGRVHRTVAQHLQRLGIDVRANLHIIRRVGFSSEDDFVPNGDHRMFRLLNILWSDVLRSAVGARTLVQEYVRGLANGVERIGIVDIGWTGNMQGGFSRLLQLSRPDFELHGYYYGTFDSINLNYLPRNSFNGYIVNENEPHDWYRRLTNGGVELLEFVLMAPHGTTLGYRDEAGAVIPVLEDNPHDVAAQVWASEVQEGALEFIEAAMPRVLAIGIDAFDSVEWSRPFERLIDDPTFEEATVLGDLTHSDSATDTQQRLPIAEALPAGQREGEKFRERRERAYWKRAFDVRNASGRA